MSSVYFAGDLHLGHKNIEKYRKQFTNAKEHDQYIYDMISSCYKKRHTYYLLGDVCFDLESLHKLKEIMCYDNVKIVLGNHCISKDISIVDWVNAGFTDIHSLVKYKEFWLSHAPIHPDELRSKKNIHGHCHNYKIDDSRYIGVSLEQIGFKFIGLDEIRRLVNEVGDE